MSVDLIIIPVIEALSVIDPTLTLLACGMTSLVTLIVSKSLEITHAENRRSNKLKLE